MYYKKSLLFCRHSVSFGPVVEAVLIRELNETRLSVSSSKNFKVSRLFYSLMVLIEYSIEALL